MTFLLSFLSSLLRVVFLYRFRQLAPLIMVIIITFPAYAAVNIPITVNLSEAVNVTGTPRIAVDVGGTTRYATYTSGTGTNALTFTLAPQAGDVDLDGVTVSSPIDLNGGTMSDTKGNALSSLAFTPPATTNVKVNYPSLGMDFVYDADGRYTLNGTVYNDLTSFLSAAGGTFTRASIGTYYDSTGTLQTAASGTPRFDYDPVTHAAKGILIEESRTNLLNYSEQFDNAIWSKIGSSIGSNQIVGIDGTLSADKIIETTATSSHGVTSTLALTNTAVYTYSVYAKAAERTSILMTISLSSNAGAYFDLSTGLVTSIIGTAATKTATIIPVGSGWYRCIFTASAGPSTGSSIALVNGGAVSYTGDGSSGAYIWGAQLELGSFSTSYITATNSSATRAADIFTISTGTWYNSNEGTGLIYFTDPDPSINRSPFTFSDGTTNNRIHLYATSALSFNVYNSGIQQAISGTYGSFTKGQSMKIGLAYKLNDFAGTYNGSSAITDTLGTVPPVNQLAIGRLTTAGYLTDNIQKFKYYPTRISNTQLQLLTQ